MDDNCLESVNNLGFLSKTINLFLRILLKIRQTEIFPFIKKNLNTLVLAFKLIL